MKTLSLERVGETDDLSGMVAEGIESARQRVEQLLRFWRGTWWRDDGAGIPYLPDLLGKPGNVALVSQAITSRILSVEDVVRVSDVRTAFNTASRTLSYSARVTTIYGDIGLEEEVG